MRHEEQKIRKYIVDNNLPEPPFNTILHDDCIKKFGWEDSMIGELYRRLDGGLKMQVGVVYKLIGYNKNGMALFFNGEAYVEPNRERMQFLIKKKKKSKKYNTEENKRLSQWINVDDDDVKVGEFFKCIKNTFHFEKGKIYVVNKIRANGFMDRRFAKFENKNGRYSKAIASKMQRIEKQSFKIIENIKEVECIFCKNTGIKKQGYDFGQPCNCEYGKKIKLDNVSEEVKEKLSNTMLFLRDEPADYDNTIEINIDKSKEESFCVECSVDFHPKKYYNNAIFQRIKDAFIVDTDNAKILYESLINRFRDNNKLIKYLNKVESEEDTSEFV